MVRARVQDGVFLPIDPIPSDWDNGHEVIVEDANPEPTETLEEWVRNLSELGTMRYEPGEKEQIQELMKEADDLAKAQVRRDMGLD